jgi:hypothetical protein
MSNLLPFGGVPPKTNVAGNGITVTNSGSTSTIALTGAPAGSLNYAQAYYPTGNAWSTTSTSFADPTSDGTTPSLTVRQYLGISLTGSSTLPAITFTPASTTSTYHIIATISTNTSLPTAYGSARLYDGTTEIAQSGFFNNAQQGQTISGIYVPGTTSPVTVKVQLANTSGSGTIYLYGQGLSPAVEWTVVEIDSLVNQYSGSANEVLATPNGSSGTAALRALVSADIPTSLPALTSASSLATVGTITTGVWNGTATSGSSVMTSGTTYTTPAGTTTRTIYKFTLIGAGGGGGGINTTSANGSGGGGGQGVVVYAQGLSPSTGYTVAIGSGGSGGISTTTAANPGGNTTISLDSITYTAAGGGAGADTVSTNGGAGGNSANTFGTGYSIAGFQIQGANGRGSTLANADSFSGDGGHSAMGFGFGGPAFTTSTAGTGIAGNGYGGGGSGGRGATATGGAGSGGIILIEWKN